jgi:glucose-6-phosphate isomerase
MDRSIRYDAGYLAGTADEEKINEMLPEIEKAHSMITRRNGEGGEFLGWLDLPGSTEKRLLDDIADTAEHFRNISDLTVIAGIGGSYLGARAAVEALRRRDGTGRVVFTGYDLCGSRLKSILERADSAEISVNVISKSGTTTETAVTFRILEDLLREKYGEGNFSDRVVCTTDGEKGALKNIADKKGYKTFVIPDDVGGRFSVLTPVGLFPIACAGVDIYDLMNGAADQMERNAESEPGANISYRYAAARNLLYRQGKRIEVLSAFDIRLHYVAEWWKQLFGESEGKKTQGVFPASCDMTTDLHSLGQFIQQGERNIYETFLLVDRKRSDVKIPHDPDDLDGLNYLAGRGMEYINRKAYEATAEAHFEGGVPNSTITISDLSAFSLGQLFYFYEVAVAASAYMFGVNPFDQPGVEAYKTKMFKLLGKPGA